MRSNESRTFVKEKNPTKKIHMHNAPAHRMVFCVSIWMRCITIWTRISFRTLQIYRCNTFSQKSFFFFFQPMQLYYVVLFHSMRLWLLNLLCFLSLSISFRWIVRIVVRSDGFTWECISTFIEFVCVPIQTVKALHGMKRKKPERWCVLGIRHPKRLKIDSSTSVSWIASNMWDVRPLKLMDLSMATNNNSLMLFPFQIPRIPDQFLFEWVTLNSQFQHSFAFIRL